MEISRHKLYFKPIPGFAFASLISFLASILAVWVGENILGFEKSPISEIMMAIILGMLVANTMDLPDYFFSGLKFCSSFILRLGIMLLGIRLSLFSAGKFTLIAIPFVLVAISVGLLAVRYLGKKMDLSLQLTGLIAVGTSICGATAIVAAAPIIKAKETEVGYAIACITIFGIVAMFSYPIIGNFLFSDRPELAGLFLGVSIHETAQVAGAGMMYQTQYNAPIALDYATVTKLVRNLCMIAVIPIIGMLYSKKSRSEISSKQSWVKMIPWFIFGFAIMSAIRSIGDIGDKAFMFIEREQWLSIVTITKLTAEKLLLVAMSAIGLTTLFAGMREIGIRPFILGLFAAVLVGMTGLITIYFFADNIILYFE